MDRNEWGVRRLRRTDPDLARIVIEPGVIYTYKIDQVHCNDAGA